MNRDLTAHTPLGEAWWAVSLTGREALSELYEFRLGLRSDDPDIDCQALLGETVAVELIAQLGQTRYFSGQIVKLAALGMRGGYWYYEATIAPKLWHASRRSDFRIWQELTVRDIANQVLQANAINFEWRLKNNYKTWEYLVQYGETDFAFLSRLFEREGIYYWFEHGPNGEKMIIGDHLSTHEAFAGYEQIPFYPPDAAMVDVDHYQEWCAEREAESGCFTHADYDFRHPSKDLTTEYNDPRGHLFDQYEIYAYPGNYVEPGDGKNYAIARLEALQRDQDTVKLRGNVRGAVPGCRFSLFNHPRSDQNRELLITSARYEITNNDYEAGLNSGLNSEQGQYWVQVGGIPADRQFRPELRTPKPRTRGTETAVVVGPQGSEIHTDQYGRVKVHFHWDRYGARDGSDSCWIRVSTSWAGKGFGSISIPRVGHEVVIDYEYADPDRPLIVGQVYNTETMPPWGLPASQNQSGILSRTTPDGSEGNALRFDDSAGAEQFMMHAQYNMDTTVNNNETHSVSVDRTTDIGANEKCTVGGTRTTTVTGDETLTCDASRTKTVAGDEKNSTTGTRTTTVTGDEKLTCEANRTKTITGNETSDITGDRKKTVGGDDTTDITGNREKTVTGNETAIITGDRVKIVKGEEDATISGSSRVTIDGACFHTVKGLREDEVAGAYNLTVIGDMTTKAPNHTVSTARHTVKASDVLISGKSTVTLQAGGSSITITPMGITLSGPMFTSTSGMLNEMSLLRSNMALLNSFIAPLTSFGP